MSFRARGFVIVLVLTLATLLLVFVLGLLSSRKPTHQAALGLRLQQQAQFLAEAGLADCQAKMAHDQAFPPQFGSEAAEFTYSEVLQHSDGSRAGCYRVSIDTSLRMVPYAVFRVRSRGVVGTLARPAAECTLTAEIDNSAYLRSNPSQPNPMRFQILSRQLLP